MSSAKQSLSIDLRTQPIEAAIKQLAETTVIEILLSGTQEISDIDLLQVIRAMPRTVRALDLPDCCSRSFLDRAFQGEAALCLEIGGRPFEKILCSDTFFARELCRTEINYTKLLRYAYCFNKRDVVEKLLNVLPACNLEEKKVLLSRLTGPGFQENPIVIAAIYAYGHSGSYQEKPSPTGSSADVEFLLKEVSTLSPYEMRCILNQRCGDTDNTMDHLRRMNKEQKQEFFKHLSREHVLELFSESYRNHFVQSDMSHTDESWEQKALEYIASLPPSHCAYQKGASILWEDLYMTYLESKNPTAFGHSSMAFFGGPTDERAKQEFLEGAIHYAIAAKEPENLLKLMNSGGDVVLDEGVKSAMNAILFKRVLDYAKSKIGPTTFAVGTTVSVSLADLEDFEAAADSSASGGVEESKP